MQIISPERKTHNGARCRAMSTCLCKNESCPIAFEVKLVPTAGLVLKHVPLPVSFQIKDVVAFPAVVNSVGCPIEVLVEEEQNSFVAGPHDVSHQLRIRGQSAKAREFQSLFRIEQRVASGIKGSGKEGVQGLIEFGTYASVPLRVDPGIELRINRGIDPGIDRRVEPGIDRSIVLRPSERVRHMFRPWESGMLGGSACPASQELRCSLRRVARDGRQLFVLQS